MGQMVACPGEGSSERVTSTLGESQNRKGATHPEDPAKAGSASAFIHSTQERSALKAIMELYGSARLNLKKTVTFTLKGSMDQALAQVFHQHQVRIHYCDAAGALADLRYSIALTSFQWNRANIANSLILSKLWHILAVNPPNIT